MWKRFGFDAKRCAVIVTAAMACASAARAEPALTRTAALGSWDMSLNDTNRRCRLTLREGEPTLAMPAGCRRAMPVLMDVANWALPAEGGLALIDKEGQPVLTFAAQDARYVATGPEKETYELVNANGQSVPRVTMAQAGVGAPQAQRPAAAAQRAAPASAPQVRMSELVGRYAVVRENARDTGCMVTLMDQARGRGFNRAQLAPACRDQGVVIFDPQAWAVERGQIVLQARKGHKLHLESEGDGLWMKKDAKPLGLKRLL